MDPDQALKDARAAYRDGDWEEAAYLYAELDRWVSRHGIVPEEWRA
jgi:hypothetical protein